MDRTLKVSLFFLTFFVVSTTLTAYADTTTSVASVAATQKSKPPHDENILMRCVYTPVASSAATASSTTSTTTVLPTMPMGFKFSLEKNNNNEIAVDSYSMNASRQVVKQVGHSELVSGIASAITSVTKPEALLANLTLAPDSPLEFLISFSDITQSSTSSFAATVTVATMFNGDIYEQVPVTCGIKSEKPTAEKVVAN